MSILHINQIATLIRGLFEQDLDLSDLGGSDNLWSTPDSSFGHQRQALPIAVVNGLYFS